MTMQTLPVGAATHHTEQTLKNRYDEALAIHEAWLERIRTSGGQDRVAAEVQLEDAWAWVEVTRAGLEAYRALHRERAAVGGRERPAWQGWGDWPYPPLRGRQKRVQRAPAASTIKALPPRRSIHDPLPPPEGRHI